MARGVFWSLAVSNISAVPKLIDLSDSLDPIRDGEHPPVFRPGNVSFLPASFLSRHSTNGNWVA
jgi:hypothetical protein